LIERFASTKPVRHFLVRGPEACILGASGRGQIDGYSLLRAAAVFGHQVFDRGASRRHSQFGLRTIVATVTRTVGSDDED
jgi:hypothetical protein